MGLLDFSRQILDQLTGETQRKAEAERQQAAELARIDAERKLAAAEKPQEPTKPITIPREILTEERQKQPGPAERLIPSAAEQLREAARPQPEKVEPEKPKEPTRMENTRDFQPAPTIAGPGGGPFTNSRAWKPPVIELRPVPETAAAPSVVPQKAAEAKPENRAAGIFQRHQEKLARDVEAERQRLAKMSPQERQADKRQTDEKWLQRGLQQLEHESRRRAERTASDGAGRERTIAGKDPRYR